MAENVTQTIEIPVPLELYGSLVTEMSPSDLPEGISPDCQDVIFFPGGVASRPGMRKWITGLPAHTSITFQKTFITPAGVPLNLILTSDGKFWVQNASVAPYLPTELTMVVPGSFASSVSAFGKEFITFHDNVGGTDIPRIFDGTYLDRATQCGPGVPPSVSNTIIPSSQMAISAGGASVAVVSATTTGLTDLGNPYFPNFIYTSLTVLCVSVVGLMVGQIMRLSGTTNATLNQSAGTITSIAGNVVITNRFSSIFLTGTGGLFFESNGTTAVRQSNNVIVSTATAHNLLAGFQAQISQMIDTVVGVNITSLVIDNENSPGVATVTTFQAHGLLPHNLVHLLNVTGIAVGGAITSAARSAQYVTIKTTGAHNLSAGATVTIAGLTDATYNGQFVVATVPSTTSFTYYQFAADSTSAGAGTVTLNWIPSTPGLLEDYYTVVSCPTPNSFQIQVSYTDGTWTSGSVTFSWNGTFYVTQVLSATSFIYQQYGPDATSTSVGTVSPFSQVSPGIHSCCVMFLTRQGLVTAPSPKIQFVANGGQYLTVSNIPLGGPEVVARYLAFTGSDGGNFFYIPVPAFVGGITVSTATALNDNVNTTMLVDFSDNTLFASVAIDIPGNNLFALGVLGRTLGVSNYASRSAWKGMKNSIQNLLNLGFEGGYSTGILNVPLGWSAFSGSGILSSAFPTSSYGMFWTMNGTGNATLGGGISQSAYQDNNGINIFQPSTSYLVDFRSWLVQFATKLGNVVIDLYSPSAGQICSTSVPMATLTNTPKFYTGTLLATPAMIPIDTVLRVYTQGCDAVAQIGIDDIEFYPAKNPQVPVFRFSYVNNPEALDLVTGILGAAADNSSIQADFNYRDTFLFLTQAKLHETNDLGGYEPANWRVREVSTNCGACSPRACSTGENFSVWMTSPSNTPPTGRGLYIYTGGSVYKLSQEIQPDFDAISLANQASSWVQIDSVTRRIYVGVPSFSVTPSKILVLDYREMDSASDIASKSPIHVSYSGKMICSDLSRKWTRWNVWGNCAAIMYVPGVGLQFCIGGGDGAVPGNTGFGNSYWFDPTLLSDQDYGIIVPYYTTYFFINHQMEQQFPVGAHRKLYKRYAIYITGVGNLQIVPFADNLSNPWPPPPIQPLHLSQSYDLGDGLNVITERCAFKISSLPASGGSDNSFSLTKFIVTLSQEPVAPLRFGAV